MTLYLASKFSITLNCNFHFRTWVWASTAARAAGGIAGAEYVDGVGSDEAVLAR